MGGITPAIYADVDHEHVISIVEPDNEFAFDDSGQEMVIIKCSRCYAKHAYKVAQTLAGRAIETPVIWTKGACPKCEGIDYSIKNMTCGEARDRLCEERRRLMIRKHEAYGIGHNGMSLEVAYDYAYLLGETRALIMMLETCNKDTRILALIEMLSEANDKRTLETIIEQTHRHMRPGRDGVMEKED